MSEQQNINHGNSYLRPVKRAKKRSNAHMMDSDRYPMHPLTMHENATPKIVVGEPYFRKIITENAVKKLVVTNCLNEVMSNFFAGNIFLIRES